jgi:hypothetical protein
LFDIGTWSDAWRLFLPVVQRNVKLNADHMTAARQARIAGFCYLLVIAGGVFAALFVRGALFAPGDVASTASAITANEALWRWGIAVHLLYLLPGAAVGVILYRLFKPVHATLALLTRWAISPYASSSPAGASRSCSFPASAQSPASSSCGRDSSRASLAL